MNCHALRITSVFAGFLCLVAIGCQNKVYDENQQLHAQNRELQARLTDAEAKLAAAPDPTQLQVLQSEIAARDATIKELRASLAKPGPGQTDDGLKGIDVTYDAKAGTMTVNLPGDILFDSGKALVKTSAHATLDKVIAVKKSYPNKHVLVEGFTDSDPITKSKEFWDDNWDLSYGRAKSVMMYLTEHGMDSSKVACVANGANKARSSKAASRRVEIVVSTR